MSKKIPQYLTVANRGVGIPAEAPGHCRMCSQEKGVAITQRQQRDPERDLKQSYWILQVGGNHQRVNFSTSRLEQGGK